MESENHSTTTSGNLQLPIKLTCISIRLQEETEAPEETHYRFELSHREGTVLTLLPNAYSGIE